MSIGETVTPEPEQEVSATGLVLVAAPDSALRATARIELELDGHEVLLARDGGEACRLFAERIPDLAILDVGIPVVGGVNACARLRSRPGGERTPIVMLTGSDDAQAVGQAYDAGATDFQAKPLNWRVLRERIKYMLRAKRDADALARLAHYDSLTGLPNRTTFRSELQRGLISAQEREGLLAVIFLDLDGFKEINDTFGHEFGDQILKLAANRLGHGLRSGDALKQSSHFNDVPIAGRFGGDEFTLCVSGIPDVEAATAVAERIHKAFAAPFQVDGREVFVTASTGVSIYPIDGRDADTLLKHADAAMYDAKALGRNNHAPYQPSMSTRSSERILLAGELRRAVEREEFRVHLQPKVEIQTGRVMGAEALIRWRHPKRGLLAPSEFMGFAEEIGLGP